MVRRRVIVRGRVQGVGYRWSARVEAERLGVGGYARNLPDGTVEVEVEGPDPAVRRMLDWLRRGPAFAEVDSLEVTEVAAEGARGFDIS